MAYDKAELQKGGKICWLVGRAKTLVQTLVDYWCPVL